MGKEADEKIDATERQSPEFFDCENFIEEVLDTKKTSAMDPNKTPTKETCSKRRSGEKKVDLGLPGVNLMDLNRIEDLEFCPRMACARLSRISDRARERMDNARVNYEIHRLKCLEKEIKRQEQESRKEMKALKHQENIKKKDKKNKSKGKDAQKIENQSKRMETEVTILDEKSQIEHQKRDLKEVQKILKEVQDRIQTDQSVPKEKVASKSETKSEDEEVNMSELEKTIEEAEDINKTEIEEAKNQDLESGLEMLVEEREGISGTTAEIETEGKVEYKNEDLESDLQILPKEGENDGDKVSKVEFKNENETKALLENQLGILVKEREGLVDKITETQVKNEVEDGTTSPESDFEILLKDKESLGNETVLETQVKPENEGRDEDLRKASGMLLKDGESVYETISEVEAKDDIEDKTKGIGNDLNILDKNKERIDETISEIPFKDEEVDIKDLQKKVEDLSVKENQDKHESSEESTKLDATSCNPDLNILDKNKERIDETISEIPFKDEEVDMKDLQKKVEELSVKENKDKHESSEESTKLDATSCNPPIENISEQDKNIETQGLLSSKKELSKDCAAEETPLEEKTEQNENSQDSSSILEPNKKKRRNRRDRKRKKKKISLEEAKLQKELTNIEKREKPEEDVALPLNDNQAKRRTYSESQNNTQKSKNGFPSSIGEGKRRSYSESQSVSQTNQNNVKNSKKSSFPPSQEKRRNKSESQDGQIRQNTNGNPNNSSQNGNSKRKKRRRRNRNIEAVYDPSRFVFYINNIIETYLTSKGKAMEPRYRFSGNLNNLESFAEELVKEGIGSIVEKELRINRKNRKQAFLTLSNDRSSMIADAVIQHDFARLHAFEGDIVKAFVINSPTIDSESSEESDSSSNTLTPGNNLNKTEIVVPAKSNKAFVISIVTKVHDRKVVGIVNFSKVLAKNCKMYYCLYPLDIRISTVYLDTEICQIILKNSPQKYLQSLSDLYVRAQIHETEESGVNFGTLLEVMGKGGELKDDLKAVLGMNQLGRVLPFDQKYEIYEPSIEITEKDLEIRTDLRKKCIFTIDPLTAKDLDDAVSVESLSSGLYEVGVHISDVTHFIEENSELDNIIKERATSIYLPTEVIEMLPKTLTKKCSLLPGEEKFAISVFQKMFISGKTKGPPRICRSIIKSCTQLAYEHAQHIIDNRDDKQKPKDFPKIHCGYNYEDIRRRVLRLNVMAEHMRRKRFLNGALSINNTRLYFKFDPETGYPIDYSVEERKSANFLIEEFMLLANQLIAKYIHTKAPDTSILRRHDKPLGKSLANIQTKLTNYCFALNSNSSNSIHTSVRYNSKSAIDSDAMNIYLSSALTKTMARAKYFCSYNVEEKDLAHYALCVPIYTHFTSPIRRYADIMVHRNLTAGLGLTPPTSRLPDELSDLAEICNLQKYRAKCAGDDALDVCFRHYVKSRKYLIKTAIICELRKESADVLVLETGHSLTVRFKDQKLIADYVGDGDPYFVYLTPEAAKSSEPFLIKLFGRVDVKLVANNKKLAGYIMVPFH